MDLRNNVQAVKDEAIERRSNCWAEAVAEVDFQFRIGMLGQTATAAKVNVGTKADAS